MPAQAIERALTAAERDALHQRLQAEPGRIAGAVQHALRIFSASLLAILLLWVVLVWPAGAIFHADWSPAGGTASRIGGLVVAAGAIWAALSARRWLKGRRDSRGLLEADIAGGKAVEDRCRFVAAKRFQEPERGGLIYFLHSDDDRVFVVYDHESQDLGANGGDPLSGGFRPRGELVTARAPNTGDVVKQEFSGAALDAGKPIPLFATPDHWPEAEAWCDVPWNELEHRYSRPEHRAA